MQRVRWSLRVLALLLLCLPSPTALARDKSFTAVLQAFERDYNIKPKHIPGMWLAKLALKVAHPSGVSKVDFVLFEDDRLRELASAPDLETRVQAILGNGWKRFVESADAKGDERVVIYARPMGRRLELFVFSMEPTEAVAFFARVKPDSLQRVLDDPSHALASR